MRRLIGDLRRRPMPGEPPWRHWFGRLCELIQTWPQEALGTLLFQSRLGLGSALCFLKESENFRISWVAARDHRRATGFESGWISVGSGVLRIFRNSNKNLPYLLDLGRVDAILCKGFLVMEFGSSLASEKHIRVIPEAKRENHHVLFSLIFPCILGKQVYHLYKQWETISYNKCTVSALLLIEVDQDSRLSK